MKTILTLSLLLASFAISAQSATPSPVVEDKPKAETLTAPITKKWTCTAEGLVEFRYDGGDWARIRLAAYTNGGSYKVVKDATGDIAKGITQDRTPFVCTLQ